MIASPPLYENPVVSEDPVLVFKSKLSPLAQVLTPKDGVAFEEARKVFNGDIKNVPRYIVKVAGVSDVIQCVKFGTQEKIRVSMRCGGHSVRGDCLPHDGLVICGSLLRNCRVDPVARTATAQQGCLLKDIDHETNAFGLCVPSLGTASDTGCMGLTLGGGQGWLSRKYGLAVDNVISADVVLADGSFVTCSQTENPDLFWAIRGGSGRFGVVTHLTYNCIESPHMSVSTVLWPFEEKSAPSILKEYCEWSAKIPIESAGLLFLNVVPLPHGPTPIVMFTLVHQGTVEECKKILEPFVSKVAVPTISNTTVAKEYIQVQLMLDHVARPGEPLYEKSSFVKQEGLTEEFIKDFVEAYVARPFDTAILGLYNMCCGGTVANEKWNASYPVESRHAAQVFLVLENLQKEREKCIKWTRDIQKKIPTSGVYVNSCTEDEKAEDCYLENLKKLRQIKKKYDPNNLFGIL